MTEDLSESETEIYDFGGKKTCWREEAMDQFESFTSRGIWSEITLKTYITQRQIPHPFDEKWTPLGTQNMTNDPQTPSRYGMEWEGPALQLPENLLLFRIYSHLITYWIPIFNSWLKSYSSVLTMANECNFTFLFLQELLSLVNGIFLSNILNFIITMST